MLSLANALLLSLLLSLVYSDRSIFAGYYYLSSSLFVGAATALGAFDATGTGSDDSAEPESDSADDEDDELTAFALGLPVPAPLAFGALLKLCEVGLDDVDGVEADSSRSLVSISESSISVLRESLSL